jgi:hypothetical protein
MCPPPTIVVAEALYAVSDSAKHARARARSSSTKQQHEAAARNSTSTSTSTKLKFKAACPSPARARRAKSPPATQACRSLCLCLCLYRSLRSWPRSATAPSALRVPPRATPLGHLLQVGQPVARDAARRDAALEHAVGLLRRRAYDFSGFYSRCTQGSIVNLYATQESTACSNSKPYALRDLQSSRRQSSRRQSSRRQSMHNFVHPQTTTRFHSCTARPTSRRPSS